MKKIRRFLKNNGAFLMVIIITALTGVITRYYSYLGEDPFSDGYYLDTCSVCSYGPNSHAYITESGTVIAVTNADNELVYKIHGGDADNSFSHASDLTIDEEGNIYVIDILYNEGGLDETQERILKFSSEGKKREILYETEKPEEKSETADSAEKDYSEKLNEKVFGYMDINALKDLKWSDGALYFSHVSTEEGLTLERITDKGHEQLQCINMFAARYIYETSFYYDGNELVYAVVLKSGNVFLFRENSCEMIWSARKKRTDVFPSVAQNAVFDSEGRLYLCDIGQRVIRCYEDGEMNIFVPQNYFSDEEVDSFAFLPIYSYLSINDDILSIVSVDSEINYSVGAVDTQGNIIDNLDTLPLSRTFKNRCIVLYLAIFLFFAAAAFSLIRVFLLLKKTHLGIVESERSSLRIKYAVLIVSFGVAFITGAVIFQSSNALYHDKSMENVTNVSILIDETLDTEYLKTVDSPIAIQQWGYLSMDLSIKQYLHSLELIDDTQEKDKDVYIIIYGIKDNVLFELYRDDGAHCVGYPMPGPFEGSIEQGVLKSFKPYYDMDNSADGVFEYLLVPCFDQNNEPIALIEAGLAYDTFVQSNDRFFFQMMLLVFSGVIIAMLLFGEILSAGEAIKNQRLFRQNKTDYSPSAIRPLAFLVFFTANITTVFLPVYGTELWNEKFPLPAEMGAALPLSAELLMSAISSFLTGRVIKKTGAKPICIIGAVFYIFGNAISAYAWNLWALILANSICGIGGGMLIMGINLRITAFRTEEEQNKGFVAYNAAMLAGVNCGTVIGSTLWENFGYPPAFFTASGCAVIAVFAALYLLDKADFSKVEEESSLSSRSKRKNILKRFFTPSMLKWLLFISIPYTLCESFLSYFFPIIAEDSGFSAAEISIAFLISGVISIYTGSALGEYITSSLGAKKAMVLASFIYGAALMYFVFNPSAKSCYVVIVLFAIADSFGISAHSVFFTSSPETKDIGENRAFGISGTIDSLASSCGSIVFGGALMLGVSNGIMIVSIVFTVLLLLYVVSERKKNTGEIKKTPVETTT